jgi:hypothetical protein
MVFGTDAPPLVSMLPKMRGLIEALAVSDADKERIFYGNLSTLLGWPRA